MMRTKKVWTQTRGYNRQVSVSVAANTLLTAPITLLSETPSNNLITRITHIGTYAGSLAAFGPATWLTPWFPYNTIKDQMGQQGMPQELSDQPEINPGQSLTISGANSDVANAYVLGIVIRGEQGYYRDVPDV